MTTASTPPSSSGSRLSIRSATTRVRPRASSLTTAERNEARRRRDSTRTTSTSLRAILIGIPGRPAPYPMSTRDLTVEGRSRRKSRLSRNKCSTIHISFEEPMRRWLLCHLTSRPRYRANRSSSWAVRALPRIEAAPCARASRGRFTCPGRRRRRSDRAQRQRRRLRGSARPTQAPRSDRRGRPPAERPPAPPRPLPAPR